MSSAETDRAQGLHLLYDPGVNKSTFDIIAIHGLGGDPLGTWKGKGTAVTGDNHEPIWIRDFLCDNDAFPQARIFSFGYGTGPSRNSRSIETLGDAALSLLGHLQNVRRGFPFERPLIFICHSLGGIVLKKALLTASDRSDQYDFIMNRRACRAVVFMGTPHLGSPIATKLRWLTNFLVRDPSYKRMVDLLADHSPELRDLASRFVEQVDRLSFIISVYETHALLDVGGVIVDQGVSRELPLPFNVDHKLLCRFNSPQDTNYRMLLGQLKGKIDDMFRDLAGIMAPSLLTDPESRRNLTGVRLATPALSSSSSMMSLTSSQPHHLIDNLNERESRYHSRSRSSAASINLQTPLAIQGLAANPSESSRSQLDHPNSTQLHHRHSSNSFQPDLSRGNSQISIPSIASTTTTWLETQVALAAPSLLQTEHRHRERTEEEKITEHLALAHQFYLSGEFRQASTHYESASARLKGEEARRRRDGDGDSDVMISIARKRVFVFDRLTLCRLNRYEGAARRAMWQQQQQQQQQLQEAASGLGRGQERDGGGREHASIAVRSGIAMTAALCVDRQNTYLHNARRLHSKSRDLLTRIIEDGNGTIVAGGGGARGDRQTRLELGLQADDCMLQTTGIALRIAQAEMDTGGTGLGRDQVGVFLEELREVEDATKQLGALGEPIGDILDSISGLKREKLGGS